MTGPIIPADKWPEWADRHCWDEDGDGRFYGQWAAQGVWKSDWSWSNIPMPAGHDWRVPVMRPTKPIDLEPPRKGLDWARPTRRREAAVELLLAQGYKWQGCAWVAPQPAPAIDLEQFRTFAESVIDRGHRGDCASHHRRDNWCDCGMGQIKQEAKDLLALIDGQAADPRIDLAADHTGMLVDYSGLIGSAQRALLNDPGIAEMLLQLRRHLEELGRRWYAGDRKVVDEFLQLYCIESDARAALVKRPTKGDGVVTAPRGPDQPDLCDLCRVRDEVRTDAEGIPFCQECWDGWQASEQPTKGEGVANE